MRPRRKHNNGTSATVFRAAIATLSIILGTLWLVVGVGFGFGGATDAFDVMASAFLVATGGLLVGEGVLTMRLSSSQAIAYIEEKSKATLQPAREESNSTQTQEAEVQEAERMLLRTDDVFSTVKDLARTFEQGSSRTRDFTHLVSMLKQTGVLGWDKTPVCGVSKLSRTDQYWLRGNVAELDARDYDCFVSVEAALNMDRALPHLTHKECGDPAVVAATNDCLRSMVELPVAHYDFDASLGRAYEGVRPEDTPGEWYCRAALANDYESVRLPFRLPYDLRANVASGLAVLWVEIPRPACFSTVVGSFARRVAHARAYALRLTWLLAAHALELVPALRHVEVLCHEHGEDDVKLAVDYTRGLVELLAPVVRGTSLDNRDFPQDKAIRVAFDANGWFLPVEPWIPFADECVSPAAWVRCPELDDRTLPMRCIEVTGAKRVYDLSINENGPRSDAAQKLVRQWRTLPERSCEAVVASIVELRGTTSNLSLSEACDRAIAALLEGSVDPGEEEALRALIVRDGALQDAVERAYELIEGDSPDPIEAIRLLRGVLDPIMAVGFYADDESCVYRYFGSVAERLAYNTRMGGRERDVRLVPDSYYNALCLLVSALGMLERHDEAEDITYEMMRIAPVSMDAAIRRARVLENESRLFEATELIMAALPYAMTPRDTALAHYRLAYLEWKLGKEELAVACYQRALTWNTVLSELAQQELDDLLGSSSNLTQLEPEEVLHTIQKEGIPLGFTEEDEAELLAASALLVDSHAFVIAVSLLSVLCSAHGDDVLVSIRSSLL